MALHEEISLSEASADIQKAFLQISLYQQDRNFLRFLSHSEEELIHYRHCRGVFGISSNPFLLGSTIQYHLEKKLEEAKQGRGKYPDCIVQKLMSSFYVDNCLASVQTQSELDRFIDVAMEIMAKRKFDLRGWEYSNPSDPIASLTNVLGMIWDRHCDTLSLNIPDLRELMEEVITKRNTLTASHKFLTHWRSLVQCCYYQNFGYKVCGNLKLVGIKK
ncbi:CCHC-type domain-containing protein [Trichonephila clavipes]|nr:CCHC-type domain-containing protein [Trichonephila clavipes]